MGVGTAEAPYQDSLDFFSRTAKIANGPNLLSPSRFSHDRRGACGIMVQVAPRQRELSGAVSAAHERGNGMDDGTRVTLDDMCIERRARKEWQCRCARWRSDPCRHGDDCERVIPPGARYVEYMGESPGYSSGTRYCWTCGVAVWAVGGGAA